MLLTKEVFQAGGQMASPKRETGQWHPLKNKLLFQTSQILLFGNSSPWSSAEVVQGHEIPLREFPKIAVVCKNTHEDW